MATIYDAQDLRQKAWDVLKAAETRAFKTGTTAKYATEIGRMRALYDDMGSFLNVWQNTGWCFYYDAGGRVKFATNNERRPADCTAFIDQNRYFHEMETRLNTMRAIAVGVAPTTMIAYGTVEYEPPQTPAGSPATQVTVGGSVLEDLQRILGIREKPGYGTPEEEVEEPAAQGDRDYMAWLDRFFGVGAAPVVAATPKPSATVIPTAAEETYTDTYAESIAKQPDPAKTLTTPKAGEVQKPVMSEKQIGQLVDALFGGWTTYQKAQLEIALLKQQAAGARVSVPPAVDKVIAKRAESTFPWLTMAAVTGGIAVVAALIWFMRRK